MGPRTWLPEPNPKHDSFKQVRDIHVVICLALKSGNIYRGITRLLEKKVA
jgi:hypothetical protein